MNHSIHLGVEHIGDTFSCHAKAKKASAEDGLGLQTRSFALVAVTLIGG